MPDALLSIFHVLFPFTPHNSHCTMRKLKNGLLSSLSRAAMLVMRDLGFKSRKSNPRARAHYHHAMGPQRTSGPTLQREQAGHRSPGWLPYWFAHSPAPATPLELPLGHPLGQFSRKSHCMRSKLASTHRLDTEYLSKTGKDFKSWKQSVQA